MPVDPDIFKSVLSQFASGVTVVTTQFEEQVYGLTVSSFSSVSLTPPLILICIDKKLYSHQMIEGSGVFAVNILTADQTDWGMRFAGMIPEFAEDRFAGIAYETAETGSPLLSDCLAWADCTVRHAYDGGDHTIFVGEVVAGAASAAKNPALYYSRAWRSLTPLNTGD